ncbi:hypothetical protein EOPP23_03785 [Endozoicomonas sp. OPT23]|uniref:NADAR domain-containing protein n=1 Tax=Endozoicomonas sp. OPT23 TaxID=2072845 RepID=UPI00129A267F|nr:NADAR domain-containing protein [Endozoicomonas sp. OPT23]MRI32115.1 hypothetical protein [Endozoicomonas sp. OPT23]
METGSPPPPGPGPLGRGQPPKTPSGQEKPPVLPATPRGGQRPDQRDLSNRQAKPHRGQPTINPEDTEINELLFSFQTACIAVENMLGQQWLNEHYSLLMEFLQNPTAVKPEELPFNIAYVDEENNIHPMETFEKKHFDQLKVDVAPLAPTQKKAENLRQQINQSIGQIEQIEGKMKQAGIGVSAIQLSPGSLILNEDRINQPVRLPGYSPVSAVETVRFRELPAVQKKGFVISPGKQQVRQKPVRTPVSQSRPQSVQVPAAQPEPMRKAARVSPQTIKASSREWLDFYRKGDSRITGQKWTRNEVMALDARRLETEHDYIQLLFPNRIASTVNTTAPLLTDQMVADIQQDEELQRLVLQSLDRILDFWGCTRSGDSIEVDASKKSALKKWALDNNDHNHKRITRVLNFLMECGYESAAASLERSLQGYRRANNVKPVRFWSEAVEGRKTARRMYFSKDMAGRNKTVRSFQNYALSHPYRDFPKAGERVDFYNREDPYYEFTNFWPVPDGGLNIDGKLWPTSEHFFQAMKYKGTAKEEEVRRLENPRDAFNYSRRPGNQARRDWGYVKEIYMLNALRAKAEQCPEFRQLLENTGNKPIYENAPPDSFWGIGADQQGANILGYQLMQVRDEIRAGLL